MNHVPFEPGNSAADLLIRVPGICAAAENLAYSVDFKSLCRELNVKAESRNQRNQNDETVNNHRKYEAHFHFYFVQDF